VAREPRACSCSTAPDDRDRRPWRHRPRHGGGGKIVNVAALSAILGPPFALPYAASTGGMVQLTPSLATTWAKDNIQAAQRYPAGSTPS